MPTRAEGSATGVALRGSRLSRLSPPLTLAGIVLGASVVLHLRDPHQQGAYGFCPWLAMTGTFCPGCGGLRAVNDLTDLRVADAASSNLLLAGAIPFFVAGWLRSVHQRWTGVLRPWPPARVHALTAIGCAAVVVFWVVRNLPFAGWLTP